MPRTRLGTTLLLWLLMPLIAACSVRSTLDALMTDQDRDLAMEMVQRLRGADSDWLRSHFDPELWAQSEKQIPSLPAMFPTGEAVTDLTGFETSSHSSGAGFERQKAFSLVTHGDGRWTVVRFRTWSDGGPEQVVQWEVVPHDAPPPELRTVQFFDAALPWIWAGLAVILLISAALIIWLVRRSRTRTKAG